MGWWVCTLPAPRTPGQPYSPYSFLSLLPLKDLCHGSPHWPPLGVGRFSLGWSRSGVPLLPTGKGTPSLGGLIQWGKGPGASAGEGLVPGASCLLGCHKPTWCPQDRPLKVGLTACSSGPQASTASWVPGPPCGALGMPRGTDPRFLPEGACSDPGEQGSHLLMSQSRAGPCTGCGSCG